jgi:hypothetical protein
MNTIVSKADLDDQRWLDGRIAEAEVGVEAVLDIYRNWTENRNLSRLHPGVPAFDYIKAHVSQFRLGRPDVPALIEGTNLSFTAIAHLTGASVQTVARDAEGIPFGIPDEPRVGIDGKPAMGGRPRKPPPPLVEGEVIEPMAEPNLILRNPRGVLKRAFGRELRRLVGDYGELRDDPKYKPVFAAIAALLED